MMFTAELLDRQISALSLDVPPWMVSAVALRLAELHRYRRGLSAPKLPEFIV
jgi:hypothetical protein